MNERNRDLYKLDERGALRPVSLRIVLAGCSGKWRRDTTADGTNAACAFCDAYKGRIIHNRKGCDICQRIYWPAGGCLEVILKRFGTTRITSWDPRWPEACHLMHIEFNRIERENADYETDL